MYLKIFLIGTIKVFKYTHSITLQDCHLVQLKIIVLILINNVRIQIKVQIFV